MATLEGIIALVTSARISPREASPLITDAVTLFTTASAYPPTSGPGQTAGNSSLLGRKKR